MSTTGDTRRMVCKTVLQIARLDDDETRDASADAHGSWVAHQIADRDQRITALEAELAALRAPAEEAGYTLSAAVDIAETLRGLRDDVQALTATLRDAAPPLVELPGPEPAERWSEPVGEMAWGRCDRICAALGYTMTLRSGDKYSVEVYHTGEGEEYDVAVYTDRLTGNDRSAQAGARAAAEISGRYDAATDRVRLTGLEPQQ